MNRTLSALCVILAVSVTACEKSPAPSTPAPTPTADDQLVSMVEAIRQANPDSEVTIEFDGWDRSDQGSRTETHNGASQGSSLRTSSDEAAQSFTSEAASLVLPGGFTITGQGVSIQNELTTASINPFYILGGMFLIAAAALAYFKRWRGMGIALGSGVVCIAVATTVEVVPFLWVWLLLASAAVGGLWLWSERKRTMAEREAGEVSKTLRAVTAAVDASPESASREVKTRVRSASESDPTIAANINKVTK